MEVIDVGNDVVDVLCEERINKKLLMLGWDPSWECSRTDQGNPSQGGAR